MAGKRLRNSQYVFVDEDDDISDENELYSDFEDSDIDLYEYFEDSECDLSDEEQIDQDPLHIDGNCGATSSERTDISTIWSSDVNPIREFPFNDEECGTQIEITDTTTPREVFDQLFTKDVISLLVNSTNKYGNELYSKPAPATRKSPKIIFHETNETELYKFLGLCFLMGQSKYPTIRHAFSKHPLYYRPIFPATMSGRRFQILLRTFSCHMPLSKEQIDGDKLARVKPLQQLLLKAFNDAYKPRKELSLDESLLLFRGRLSFRQYIKTKAAKYGIKFYELTSSDGYVLNVKIYQGADEEDSSNDKTGKTGKIVLHLMEPYLDKGHHLYMDNFYNSVYLSTHLLSRQTHTTGTLRSNRKGNPKEVIGSKLKKGDINWQGNGDVYVTKWKDKRDVLTITTAHHPGLIETKNRHGEAKMKPCDVADYNQYMSGVDRLDQMISYYSTPRKTIRWYKKVLFHLIDIAVWNAYFLYKQTKSKTTFLMFRDSLIESLIKLPESINEGRQLVELAPSLGRTRTSTMPPTSTIVDQIIPCATKNSNKHRQGKIPLPIFHKKNNFYKRCETCANNKIRKDTSYRCDNCPQKPPMCPQCFEDHQPGQDFQLIDLDITITE